jgi:hypothetical protein
MSQTRGFPVVNETQTDRGGAAASRKNEQAASRPSGPSPGPAGPSASWTDSLVKFFTSLRLTVVCLGLGMVLVFAGTLAQVDLGLYKTQNEFFQSLFVFWGPKGASWKIPVFPGGYLIGGVLLINLIASHFQRFTFSRKKAGIWMVHFGLILLLLGQLLTDRLSHETTLHLRNGEARNYTETERECELAVVDTTAPNVDTVVAIPQGALVGGREIRNDELPFTIKVKNFFPNSQVENRQMDDKAPPAATQGLGPKATVEERPRITEMDRRDVPSAVIEILTPQGSLGTWLVSEFITGAQEFTSNNRTYQLTLRPRRHYKPFSIQLLKFSHDVYAGTDTPKNFSSRVLLQRPATGEKREVLIYMNSPLRYAGETFYQQSFDTDDGGTILQVVHNPSWLTPYFAVVLVGAGLLVQFATHLFGFTFKRKAA